MKTERLIVGGVALLVGLLLGWMVRGVSTFNTHAATIAAYDDWRVACPAAETKDVNCELSSVFLGLIFIPRLGGLVARLVSVIWGR